MNNIPEIDSIKRSVEALLFISGEGMSVHEIATGIDKPKDSVRIALDSLVDEYLERDGGIHIQESAGRFMFITNPVVYTDIREFLREKKKETLSKAMLETLAIITYKQPVTQVELDEIRGVNSRTLVTGLISRKLVKSMGQKEAPGRPVLYGTTKEFLEYFGLNSLDELPAPKDVKELSFEEL